MSEIEEHSILKLARGVRLHFDEARQFWVLLAPERMIKLDDIGAAIMQEVDGEQDFTAIINNLVAKYNAPEEQITKDTRIFLADFHEKQMLEMAT